MPTHPPDPTWRITSGEDLGRALREVRHARQLTQEELAELTGLHRSYVAAIEAGRSVQLLDRILLALRRMGAEVTITLPGADG